MGPYICRLGLFYYFVTLSYSREEREGTIKETKSLFVCLYGLVQIATAKEKKKKDLDSQ